MNNIVAMVVSVVGLAGVFGGIAGTWYVNSYRLDEADKDRAAIRQEMKDLETELKSTNGRQWTRINDHTH